MHAFVNHLYLKIFLVYKVISFIPLNFENSIGAVDQQTMPCDQAFEGVSEHERLSVYSMHSAHCTVW